MYGNGGQRVQIEHQEFPYDIGIWKNLCQAFGTTLAFLWFLPFGGGPTVNSANNWETNGFEDDNKIWPPLDPDKMPRGEKSQEEFKMEEYRTIEEEVSAFKRRQREDYMKRGQKLDVSEDEESYEGSEDDYDIEYEEGIDGEEGWTNSDGDRLRDYGVDEEAEVIGDDDVPIGELLRRRRV